MQAVQSNPRTVKPCRKCGELFFLSYAQVRNRNYICGDCKNASDKAYRSEHGQMRYPASPSKIKSDSRYYRSDKGKAQRRAQYARMKSNPQHAVKMDARLQLKKHIASGIIKREPCRECGNPKSEGHHFDYSRPLQVIWLCRKHHNAAHGNRSVTL